MGSDVLGSPGACPGCLAAGPVGQPCPQPTCQTRGYGFVPAEPARKHARSTDAASALVGRRIDKYLLLDVLGRGGNGVVYLALQLPIGLRAALKLITHTGDDSPEVTGRRLRRFEDEARALARLAHPNIVQLLEYGASEGRPFLVMQYVEGGRTLHRELAGLTQRGRVMAPGRVRGILVGVLHALSAAHDKGVVHRDVKPANIMLQSVAGNPDLVRVLDFGLAKFFEDRSRTVSTAGTPTYMAPEQIERRGIGPATDLYAVGVMLFEMTTGRSPFTGRTIADVMAQKMAPDYDPTAVLADLDWPEPALALLGRGVARDPRQRFHSADEMIEAVEALTAWLDDPSQTLDLPGTITGDRLALANTAARLPSSPTTLATGEDNWLAGPEPAASDRRLLPIWAGLAGLVLLAGAAIAFWVWHSAGAPAADPPPPAPEPPRRVIRWKAEVLTSRGHAVAVGRPCEVVARMTSAPEVDVTCGDHALYRWDEPSRAGDTGRRCRLEEDRLSWAQQGVEVTDSIGYRLRCSDVGSRPGPRPQLLVDTYARRVVIRRAPPATAPFRVTLKVEDYGTRTEGERLYSASWGDPGFSSPLERSGVVATTEGAPPVARDTPCQVVVAPVRDVVAKTCSVRVRCGERPLYERDLACSLEVALPARADDTLGSHADQTPLLAMDLPGDRVAVWEDDERAGGIWRVEIALEPAKQSAGPWPAPK